MPHSKLLALAPNYTDAADFKRRNLSKYLICRRHRLLATMFLTAPKPVTTRGVYKLYDNATLRYIGYSLTDIKASIDASTVSFTHYTYYSMHSTSDILVGYHYLVHSLRPPLNTEAISEPLTIRLDNFTSVFGKQQRGIL